MPSRICRPVSTLGYDLDEEAEFPGTALFHGKTFEIFPAGALNPFRIEHAENVIRKIVAVDPEEHDVMFEVKELVVDPMFERLALEGKRGQRATLPDYCGRARWIADAGIPGHADGWLSTIEEAAGQKEVEREYLGRGEWKKLAKRMKHPASQGRLRADPRFLEDGGAEKSTPRLCRRDATRQDAAAPCCSG
jgi:Transcription-repair coupling factor (superfamily II helicase)